VRKDGAEDKFLDEAVEAMITGENEILGRERPKTYCYETISKVIYHLVSESDAFTMAVKAISSKGANNKPKPYVLV